MLIRFRHGSRPSLHLLLQNFNTRCTRARTLAQPPTETLLSNRLAIIIGVSAGLIIVFFAVLVICCCKLCTKGAQDHAKPHETPQPAAGSASDYLSYRQYGSPSDAQQEGFTAC